MTEQKKQNEGTRNPPHQSDLKRMVIVLEDLIDTYENYLSMSVGVSAQFSETLEATIQNVCKCISDHFETT